jgi:hypothetical protein
MGEVVKKNQTITAMTISSDCTEYPAQRIMIIMHGLVLKERFLRFLEIILSPEQVLKNLPELTRIAINKEKPVQIYLESIRNKVSFA